MNTRKLIITTSALTSILLFATPVYAQTTINTCPTSGPFNRLCNLNIGTVIGTAITYIFVVAAIVALGFLIWGGLKWIISGGDKSAVQGAKDHIIAALIGLVVIFLSYVILSLVLNFFGISTFNFSLPNI